MGTETFTAFKSDGTAYKLKGRILRHLDNDPVTDADKSNIRTTLGITSQGGLGDLLAANNLSDVASAATSRANLSVNSVDEDAEANGTKLLGPSVYFDGSNDVVTVAHDAKQHFNDGSDDLPFSLSFWIKTDFSVAGGLVGKYQAGAKEFVTWVTGTGLRFNLSDGTDEPYIQTASLTAYSNKWTHIAITSAGSGPNSANDFPSAIDSLSVYVNGEDITTGATKQNEAAYGGLNNSLANITIMSFSGGNFKKGELRSVQIFNRELTAAEVADLARGNELGFADQYAGALGGVYTSDFSAGVDGWSTADVSLSGNVDSVSGRDDNLEITISATTANHRARKLNQLTIGKRYRISFDYYLPSANTGVTGFGVYDGTQYISALANKTQDAWTRQTIEAVVGGDDIDLYLYNGSTSNFLGNGTDLLYIRNVKFTAIGTLADFRSERFDSSTNKWYDLSDNAFIGTNSGATLVGREVGIYETGTWTPSITFGGGSTGIAYTAADGYYTRVGDICFVRGAMVLSSKGDDTGMWKINNLPYDSTSAGINSSFAQVYLTTAAGLTSLPFGLVDDGGNGITLFDNGATGATVLTNANAQNTTTIRFSATYQIQ